MADQVPNSAPDTAGAAPSLIESGGGSAGPRFAPHGQPVITGINRIGMVISDPASALLNLSLLGDFLTLRFYNDGEEVDSATVGGGLLGLELLGLSLDSDERFLSAEVDTNELTFDEVQLDYAGLLNVNGSLRVHRVCAGNDPEDAP